MKSVSAENDFGPSNRDNFVDQIRLCAEVPFLMLGCFDSRKRKLVEWSCSTESKLDPAHCAQIVAAAERRLAVFTAALPAERQSGEAAPETRPGPQFPIWLHDPVCSLGLAMPVAWFYPVVGYRTDSKTRTPLDPKLERLAFTYVSQTLAKDIYGRKTWSHALVETTLRVLSIEFFMVDADCEVVVDGRTSDSADNDGWIVLNNRLTLADPRERAVLKEAIQDAALPPHSAAIVSVTVAPGDVRLAAVAPVEAAATGFAVVLFEARNTDHQALRTHFFRAHGLTRSESLIAHEILDGKSLAQAAATTNYALETARSYLKQVFSKTGTHRQSELVSLYYSSILPIGRVIAASEGIRVRGNEHSNSTRAAFSQRN